jgi:CDGSH-type Zn-finger protein
VRVCPDGPMLVRGAESVVDAAGDQHDVTRPVVALCACGKSQRMPWCDSTHKSLRRGTDRG